MRFIAVYMIFAGFLVCLMSLFVATQIDPLIAGCLVALLVFLAGALCLSVGLAILFDRDL